MSSKRDRARKQRDRYIQAMEMELANDALTKQVADLQNNINAATRYMAVLVARNGGTVTITLAELDEVKDKTFTVAFDGDHAATFTVQAKAAELETQEPEAETTGEAAPSEPAPLTVEVQPPATEFAEQPTGLGA